jgi:hypothetical protein
LHINNRNIVLYCRRRTVGSNVLARARGLDMASASVQAIAAASGGAVGASGGGSACTCGPPVIMAAKCKLPSVYSFSLAKEIKRPKMDSISNYICPHAIVFITLYVAQAALDKKETLLATQFILMRL